MEFESGIVPHLDYIRGLLSRWCGNPSDVDDIEQEVLIRIYLKLNQFRGEADIKSWIYRITLNTMYSFYKTRQRRQENFDGGAEDLPYLQADLDEVLFSRELLFKIYDFVNEKSEKCRWAFELVILRDLSYAEASREMGVSTRCVGVILTRLRKNIRERFDSARILTQ